VAATLNEAVNTLATRQPAEPIAALVDLLREKM
jgi:hypothetical protein